MSDPTFFAQDDNISPRTWHPQFQTPRFSCKLTISGPDNVRPHAFRARLQYQAPNMTPTISDPTLFAQAYNIRPRQCQTPRSRARRQYQSPNMTPTISVPTLFVRDYNNDQKPSSLRQRFIFLGISQPRTFMSRHTSLLKGFIYLIKERPNVKLHFKISVNDMYLRGINWSFNGSPYPLIASRRLIFTYTTLLKLVFENTERGLPVLSMNITINISGVKLNKYPNKEML